MNQQIQEKEQISDIEYQSVNQFELTENSILSTERLKEQIPVKQKNTCDSENNSLPPPAPQILTPLPKKSSFLEDLERFTKQLSFQDKIYNVYDPTFSSFSISESPQIKDQYSNPLQSPIINSTKYIIDFSQKNTPKTAKSIQRQKNLQTMKSPPNKLQKKKQHVSKKLQLKFMEISLSNLINSRSPKISKQSSLNIKSLKKFPQKRRESQNLHPSKNKTLNK